MLAERSSSIAGLFLVVATLSGSARDDDKPVTFSGLKLEHERAQEAFQNRQDAARSDAERAACLAESWDEIRSTARRVCDWAEANPGDPEALDAIIWTVHGGLANGNYAELSAEQARTYRLLTRLGLASEKVAPVCYYASGSAFTCPDQVRFLEAALGTSPNRLVRGSACLGLARADKGQARMARRSKDPVMRKPLEKGMKGLATLDELAALDPIALDRGAEGYYRRVIAEFGDLKLPYPYNEAPFAEQAQGELYEMSHLEIGQVLPDFDGEDVKGGKLRLGDFRGKVTAIVFWASWCGPCMAQVPHERGLVKRMAGKPFALLGVNGDDDRPLAASLMAKESMTWPSFWNGGKMGSIVEKLAVRAWPTIYVLDGAGVIRYKNVRGETLDEAVDRLVAEVEAGEE